MKKFLAVFGFDSGYHDDAGRVRERVRRYGCLLQAESSACPGC
ncbi:MAG: hypothetical protein RSI33_04885 [Clostridia bacterium]